MFLLKFLSRRHLLWIPAAVPFVGGCLFYLKESIEQSIAVSNLTAATSTNNSTSEHLQSYIYLPAELTGRLLLNEGDVGNHGDVSHPTITDDDGSQFILKKKKFAFFSSSSSQNRANPLDETLFEQDDSVFSTAKDLKALRLSQSSDLQRIINAALSPNSNLAAFRRPLKTLNHNSKMLLRLSTNQTTDNDNNNNSDQPVHFELNELMNHLLRCANEMKDRGSECARYLTEQALVLFDDHHHHHHHHLNIDLNDIFSTEFAGRDSSRLNSTADFRRYQNLYFQAILENLLSSREHVSTLLENGLLVLLHRLRELFPEKSVQNWISACLSAISVYEDLARQHFYHSGWIGVLADWLQAADADLRLSLEAAKTLHNLAYSPAVKLHRSLYILHPIHQTQPNTTSTTSPQADFDIIFIHGLQGGVFKTWRQADSAKRVSSSSDQPYSECWPKSWLPLDFPNCRVLAVNYQTFLSNWLVNCGNHPQTLRERSAQLAEELRAAQVGDRPIIWVAHSMGGLLVKEMLCQMEEDKEENSKSNSTSAKCILEQTKGVVFFSVPNLGSEMAVWSPHMQRIISPSAQVLELRKDSATLKELNQRFINLSANKGIECLSFGEGEHSLLLRSPIEWKFLLVPEESANPGVGQFIVLPEDHFHICKPKSREAASYRELVNFIAKLVGDKRKTETAEELLPNDLLLSSCVL